MLLLLLLNTWNDGFEESIQLCQKSDYWSDNEAFRKEVVTLNEKYEQIQFGLPEDLQLSETASKKPGKKLIFEYFKYRLKIAQLKEIAEPDFKIYKQGAGAKKGNYYQAKGYWVEDYEIGMTLKRTRSIHLHLGEVHQFTEKNLNPIAQQRFREELWNRYVQSSSLIDNLIF